MKIDLHLREGEKGAWSLRKFTISEKEAKIDQLRCAINGKSSRAVEAGEYWKLTENGYTFPVYYDTGREAAVKYGVSSVPMSFFIDAEGYFVTWVRGALNAAMLQKCMDLLLG